MPCCVFPFTLDFLIALRLIKNPSQVWEELLWLTALKLSVSAGFELHNWRSLRLETSSFAAGMRNISFPYQVGGRFFSRSRNEIFIERSYFFSFSDSPAVPV